MRDFNNAGKKGYVTVGDAIAAVERTTGGARGTTTGGGPPPAQAPSVDPRVASLTARIREGEALALKFRAAGQEEQAIQVNNDVQRLVAERDRLDAPRQEFLKKQAVQGLELEQREREGSPAPNLRRIPSPPARKKLTPDQPGLAA